MQKRCEDPLLLLSLVSIITLHVFSRLLNWGGGGGGGCKSTDHV